MTPMFLFEMIEADLLLELVQEKLSHEEVDHEDLKDIVAHARRKLKALIGDRDPEEYERQYEESFLKEVIGLEENTGELNGSAPR